MALIGLVAAAIMLGGQILLVASVVRRLRTGESLTTTLRAHAVLPARARSVAAAVTVEVAQVALGLAGPIVVGIGHVDGAVFTAVCLATAALFAGFTIYLVVVARRRGRVRCSCVGSREQVGAPAAARAGIFAVAAAAAGTLGVPADELTWAVRIALALGAALVAGFATFLVALHTTDAPAVLR